LSPTHLDPDASSGQPNKAQQDSEIAPVTFNIEETDNAHALRAGGFMKRSSVPHAMAELSSSLNHQLNMYALAASAAGVGLLALAQPVEAKIIYTPAHAKVVFGKPLPLDLNHDGIVDFYLIQDASSPFRIKLSACQYVHKFASGSIFCSPSSRGTNALRRVRNGAAVLRAGAKIQNGEQFAKSQALMGGVQPGTGSDTIWYGPWVNGGKGVKHRYLGLKFKIKGHFHFGWARVTIATTRNSFTATVTGYAYETIAGKAVIAGETKGSDLTTVFPASLGQLAAGASAIPLWRVEQTAATTH
jgi:hypothetical protein